MVILHPEQAGNWAKDDKAKAVVIKLVDSMRTDLHEVCKEKRDDQLPRPKWLPEKVTADLLFGIAHVVCLVITVASIVYTCFAVFWEKAPELWFMELAKLTYPVCPVVLMCWASRRMYGHTNTDGTMDFYEKAGERKWWRMTPGYYFANMKMALLPSLGPGFVIFFLFDKLIFRTKEYIQEPSYIQFMKASAWILGCIVWLIIARILKDKLTPAEGKRADYGIYRRFYVDPRPDTHWKTWIHKGPHIAFFVIPCPEHGTVLKVFEANSRRAAGITLCCLLVWVIMFFVWLKVLPEEQKSLWEFKQHPWASALLETEFPSFVVNTITAPFLIWYTWRAEPREALAGVKQRDSLRSFLKGTGVVIMEPTPSGQSGQILLQDESEEMDIILEQVVTCVMNYPVSSLVCSNPDLLPYLSRDVGM